MCHGDGYKFNTTLKQRLKVLLGYLPSQTVKLTD